LFGRVSHPLHRAQQRRLHKLERDERYYSEQITGLYSKLLLHEKPKLQSIEVTGDPAHSVYQEVDLKSLSNDDLEMWPWPSKKLGTARNASNPRWLQPDFPGVRRWAGQTRLALPQIPMGSAGSSNRPMATLFSKGHE
jgi:hypothetical protein